MNTQREKDPLEEIAIAIREPKPMKQRLLDSAMNATLAATASAVVALAFGAIAGHIAATEFVEDLISEKKAINGVQIGSAAFITSHVLNVRYSGQEPDRRAVSDEFRVPLGFTGLLIVHGPGGNMHTVFVIGSDGNADFSDEAGFLRPIEESKMNGVTIGKGDSKDKWLVKNIPRAERESKVPIIRVVLVGAAFE